MAALQPTGLCLLLPLHPIDPSSGGRVRGNVSFVAEAEAEDGADAGGRDNVNSQKIDHSKERR
jgi:hypothetical protein